MSFSIKEAPQIEKTREVNRERNSPEKFKKVYKETPAHEKKREDKKKVDSESESASFPYQPLLSAAPPPSALMIDAVSESITSSALHAVAISAEIEALFEKMAGTIILACSSLETETSIFLDAPQFSASPFYGTHISIKEFSTAPKAFNIEIATSPAALALLEPHKADLLAFFEKGNFNFSIGRISTHIQESDRPLFHRKESVSQEDESNDREAQQ